MKKFLKIVNVFISFCLLLNNSFYKVQAQGNIKISVIIPVYNTECYLKDCLDSIIGQSLNEIEVICVNDGSTDNSLNILNEYAKKDSRIKVISEENKGGASARNAGIEIARGEYIAFIDSDDTIDLDAYKISYEKAISNDVDILMFGEDKFSTEDIECTDGFSALNVSGAMMLWNKLYKRSFINDNQFRILEEAQCYHDECFNSVVFPKAKRVKCISNKFYHYRRHREGSIQTSSNRIKKCRNALIYADYVCNDWRRNNYVKNHGEWLLMKIILMVNRNIKFLEQDEKQRYAKSMMDIVKNDIYCSENMKSFRIFENNMLKNWIKNI